MTSREQRSNTWWRGETEGERFLLYYTCLRVNYEMSAQEALRAARENWSHFGEKGDLIGAVRQAIQHAP